MTPVNVTEILPLESMVEWIEAHQTTVDLIKWAIVLFLAWIAGGFKYLRNKLRRPSISLEENTSRCLIEEFEEFEGHKNAVRATLLIEMGVLNPTNERINVRSFNLAIKRERFWSRWKPELIALSLPSRPRFQTGSGVKIVKNWFSNFSDEFASLTLTGVIEPKEYPSAFLLFVSFTSGPMSPKIEGQYLKVKGRANLTTGETFTVSGKVRVMTDIELFESWLPGIKLQINHDSAWGATKD